MPRIGDTPGGDFHVHLSTLVGDSMPSGLKVAPGHNFCGRIDPDGRFVYWSQKLKRRLNDGYSSKKENDPYFTTLRELRGLAAAMGASLSQRRVSPGMSKLLSGIPQECVPEGPGLSRVSNSEKNRKPRGSNGLTRHGARLIRNGGILIEQRFGKQTVSMFTGTLPALSVSDWELVRSHWSKGWDLFMRKVNYHLKENRLCRGIVACFEVQEKRQSRTGEPGLHVHMLFHARRKSSGPWLMNRKLMSKLWAETWENLLGSKYKWSAASRTEEVVKSVASYLGKYLSKGLKTAQPSSQTTSEAPLLPSWYAVSACIRQWIKRSTLYGSHIGEFIHQSILEEDSNFYWYRTKTISVGIHDAFPIACYGSCHYGFLDPNPPPDCGV